MENPAIISNGSIEQPRLWRLALQLDNDALQAVVWSTVEDSTLVHFSLPLDPTLPQVKALEEAVYAAPVLLSDFGSVDVVVRTNAYMPVPQGLDEDTGVALMEYACLSAGSNQVIVKADRAAAPGMDMLWTAMPRCFCAISAASRCLEIRARPMPTCIVRVRPGMLISSLLATMAVRRLSPHTAA